MPESAQSSSSNLGPNGFQISDRPIDPNDRVESEITESLPATYGTDLLYVIARDPASLFVYWDLNWRQAFKEAGVSPRAIHLRTYRTDGRVESTQLINPFRGHCYIEVSAAGTGYFCELGCFDQETWYKLARSGEAMTPESELSDDLSATFATLPIHLSFQRLLDIFQATKKDRKELALSVAELQAEARNGGSRAKDSSDLAALLESAGELSKETWTEAQRAVWQRLTEQVAEPDGSGASERNFGGSSIT
jgi:hypothetical protein